VQALKFSGMDRRLIINADDFGLCTGINRAVEQAHRDGVLTSATIMANMPAAEEAAAIARKLPGLGAGVHLNLTEGAAISKEGSVKCLVNSKGNFAMKPYMLSGLSMVSHKIRKAIRAELSSQIQWVIDKGIRPTHLDSHKHIHCFAAIFTIVCDLARRFNISAIRWAFEPKYVTKAPWPLTSKQARNNAAIVRTMAWINSKQRPYFIRTGGLLGLAHIGKTDVNFFRAVSLYCKTEVIEVMTHPGNDEGLSAKETGMVKQRQDELKTLCDERTKRYLKEANIRLIHYGQL